LDNIIVAVPSVIPSTARQPAGRCRIPCPPTKLLTQMMSFACIACRYYTVESDTPRSIAKEAGVSVADFIRYNEAKFPGLTPTSQFEEGSGPLWVPPAGRRPNAKAAGKRKRAPAKVAAESSGDESNYSAADSDDGDDSHDDDDDGEEEESDDGDGESDKSESSASVSDDSGPSRKNRRLLSQKKQTRGKPGDKVRLIWTWPAVVSPSPIVARMAGRGGANSWCQHVYSRLVCAGWQEEGSEQEEGQECCEGSLCLVLAVPTVLDILPVTAICQAGCSFCTFCWHRC